MKAWFTCPRCKSNKIYVLLYDYLPGRCITYECSCQDCGCLYTSSYNLSEVHNAADNR